jgi:hypothetical protein
MRTAFSAALVVALALSNLAASTASAGERRADWTFALYMNADNNLEDAAIANFLEMAQVGSTAEVNIILQMDRIPGFTKDYGDWTDARRFHVAAGMTPDPGSEVQILGEVNMGVGPMMAPDDGSLEDFLRWTCTNYPANRTALILWDHGDGWRSVSNFDYRTAGQDWTSDDKLTMPEVRQAFENAAGAGCSFDLIGFDECLMAMIENAYQVHEFGDVMVASEKLEPGSGWPYHLFMADLTAAPTMDAQTLGTTIVHHFGVVEPNETLSAVDLNGIPALVADVNDLAIAMDTNKTEVQTARGLVRQYNSGGGKNHVDLFGFAGYLTQEIPAGKIHDAAVDVLGHQSLVLAAHGKPTIDNGLTIFFPELAPALKDEYSGDTILFTRNTHWDDFLRWYFELPWLYTRGAVVPGQTIEVRVTGTPGVAPVTLALGAGIQDPPMPTTYGDLYITLPPAALFFLGPMTPDGIVIQPAIVPTVWQPGDEHPFQALVGPPVWGSLLTNLMIMKVE